MADRAVGRRLDGARYGRLLLAIGFVLMLSATSARAAEGEISLGERWSGTVPAGTQTVLHGDLTGDGQDELIVAVQQVLRVYVWDAVREVYELRDELGGLPAPASTLALGDVLPGGGRALLVGTAGSGVIRVYRVTGSLQLVTTVGRLWSTVTEIHSTDIDGDGLRDVIAMSESGDVVLFRQEDGEYREVWRPEPAVGPFRYLAVGDVTGDGLPEVIVGTEYDGFRVYSWQSPEGGTTAGMQRAYEGFPWGRLQSLDLADWWGSGRLDLLLVTDAGALYIYGMQEGSIDLQRVVDAGPLLGVERLQILRAFPPDRPVWVGTTSSGVALWEWVGGTLEQQWFAPIDVAGLYQGTGGSLSLLQPDRTLRVLEPAEDTHLRILRSGEPYVPQKPVLHLEGEVWIAAEDWHQLLGVIGWFTQGGTRWTGVTGDFQFFVVDAEAEQVTINGRKRPLAPSARMVDAHLYIPITFLEVLERPHTYEASIRTLQLP